MPGGPLDEAAELAEATGELQRLAPLAVARAEAAWLEGDLAREAPLVASVFPLAEEVGTWLEPRRTGVLAVRAGELDEPPARIAEPYALQIRGRWTEAAALWNEIGSPYERAIALAEAGDGSRRPKRRWRSSRASARPEPSNASARRAPPRESGRLRVGSGT